MDRVIHHRGRVSPETEGRIRRIIEQLGYKPNVFAKNLKLGKPLIFGVLMPKPSQDNAYWTLPIRGINKAQEELASQKIEVRYFFYDKYSKKSFHKTTRDVLEGEPDGLIIAPALSGEFDEFVKQHGFKNIEQQYYGFPLLPIPLLTRWINDLFPELILNYGKLVPSMSKDFLFVLRKS